MYNNYIIYVCCYSIKFKKERTLICFIPDPNNKKQSIQNIKYLLN